MQVSDKILSVKEVLEYNYPQKAVLAYSQVLRYKKYSSPTKLPSPQPSPLRGEGVATNINKILENQ